MHIENARPALVLTTCLCLIGGLGGCSSGDDGGPCAQRSGTYRIVYTERSGNCGALTETIGTIDAQPTAPPAPCTGEIRYSEDNCEVTNVNITCPEPAVSTGAYSIQNGKYSWSTDGSSGSGSLNLKVYDGNDALLCQSTYSASAQRL
ncbi:MAG: hypothetical protein R3B07_35805 [Polyangiaceae bacterium]